MMKSSQTDEEKRSLWYRIGSLLVMTIIFLAFAVPLSQSANIDTFDAFDEVRYHFPTILNFSDTLPYPQFRDYNSATTPGYHILLAIAQRMFELDLGALRFINVLFSMAVIVTTYLGLIHNSQYMKPLIISFCLATSPYFLGCAIRLSTDNLALFFVFAAIIVLDSEDLNWKASLLSVVLATFAVLTRQIYVWLSGYIFVMILIKYQKPISARLPVLFLAAFPALVLVPFVVLWSGLTPPAFQDSHEARYLINPRALTYAIAALGMHILFFVGWYWHLFRVTKTDAKSVGLIVFLAVIFLVLVSRLALQSQCSGLINSLSTRLPYLFSINILYWIMFPIGIVALYLNFRWSFQINNYAPMVFFIFWLLANMASQRVYEKYYDPFLIFFVGYSFKSVNEDNLIYHVGPAFLCVIFLAIDFFRFVV